MDELSQMLWQDLTGNKCYGDAFKLDTTTLRQPKLLKTGFPCPDYTSLGSQLGEHGKTGDAYTRQGNLILRISPDAAVIEQTGNAININKGDEVNKLIQTLSKQYIIHQAVVPVWRYGDPSNRQRLMIVALHKRLGAPAHDYKFPDTKYDERRYHIAMDVAQPDDQIPPEYILEGSPVEMFEWSEPVPGQIHQLGKYGEGAGDHTAPHPLQSWWGLANTQLTSNGGARRVMLSWKPGDPITLTRLTTPTETIRMASLPNDYQTWVRQFDSSDVTLRRLVNNGVPLQTSTAIDESIYNTLTAAGVQPDIPASNSTTAQAQFSRAEQIEQEQEHSYLRSWAADEHTAIRSKMADTGASGTLSYTDVEPHLQNSTPSQYQIAVAKGDATMDGSKDGQLPIFVLNTAQQPGVQQHTPLLLETTTVAGLRTELLSLDKPYRHGGFNILLRQPDYESGANELYRPAKDGAPELRIPLRYDYAGPGGWWLDYIINIRPQEAHYVLLQRHHLDLMDDRSEANAARLYQSTYTPESANKLFQRLRGNEAVAATKTADDNGLTSIIARHGDERQIRGVKAGLKHGRDKLSIKQFHRDYAHIGDCGDDCQVCRMVKGSMRRIYKYKDPYRDTRPGHTWSMDTITFSHRSLNGSKYATVLRCKATGVIKILCLYLRSDIVTQFEAWVRELRADPAYSNLTYKAVTTIITDNAGEWSKDATEWQAMIQRVKNIEMIYVTPETSKEAGHAESSNSIVEETTKAILMQQNLPEDHWEIAARSAEWLLNRFPNLATDVRAPVNGDQALPLELITQGRYSRRQIYRELSYYVMPGTPALVHMPHVRGSTLAPKVRWGVAWGMYREQVTFKCPFTGATFRSKSFTAFDLRENMNYAQFMGLPTLISTRKSLALPEDVGETVHVHLQPVGTTSTGTPPVVQLQQCSDDKVQHIYVNAPENSELADAQPLSKRLKVTLEGGPCSGLGGSVTQQQQPTTGPAWENRLQPQTDTTYRHAQGQSGMMPAAPGGDLKVGELSRDRAVNSTAPGRQHEAPLTPGAVAFEDSHQAAQGRQYDDGSGPQAIVPNTDWLDHQQNDDDGDTEWLDHLEYDDSEEEDERTQNNLDQIAHILAERDAITTGINMSFTTLCKKYSVPHELHDIYYQWLLSLQQSDQMRFNQEQLPRGRGKYLKVGLKIPAPHGRKWRELIDEKNLKQSDLNKMRVVQANHLVIEAIARTIEGVKAMDQLIKYWDKQDKLEANQARKAKKKRRTNRESEGGKQPPISISKALRDENRTEAYKWLISINKEWNGLTEMGVLDHGYTRQELLKMGITSNPIPFSICFTYKYDKHGDISRYKTRMALAGHRGNMIPGVHFDKTYSSTPVQHTSKIIQALMVRLKLHRMAFDIKMAYCQADMPDDQLVAVRYPEGYRRYSDSGEELFMVLRKNLYGHPAAGRHWEKERNRIIMEEFNKNGWTCTRCIKDPCVFVIKRGGKRTWMLVWTDDCDLVGEDENDLQLIHTTLSKHWECNKVDPSYMLGVRREITHTPEDEMEVELTMTAYIESIAETFQEHLIKRTISTPVPEGFFTWKKTSTTEEESKAVLNRGYQQLFGCLLWAARGTFPECLQGCSQLGRVMSQPSEEDWNAACHMLTYLEQHKTHGIKFTSKGNKEPIVFVDASNRPDPTDGKCQYGYCHLWQGGCIVAASKKLSHVGLSAAHNEYMAAHWANRHTAWLRDLLTEMDVGDAVAEPTTTYGDNRAANLLCEEDIVTCGNQFIQVPYHFNKEAVQSGAVRMKYCPTKQNLADLFTKSVPRQVIQELLPAIIGHRQPPNTARADQDRTQVTSEGPPLHVQMNS